MFDVHELKIQSEYFRAVRDGLKTFEVRKMDRDYKVGDILALYEYDGEIRTGGTMDVKIIYIFDDASKGYLKDGYGILGIAPLG